MNKENVLVVDNGTGVCKIDSWFIQKNIFQPSNTSKLILNLFF